MSRALLYGHRGASAVLPENTLSAFERALALGATALESDVHLTRDGHVVLSHDPDGRRMAGVDRAIRASSLEEVKSWDVGWGFVGRNGSRPHAGRGFVIPTLDEVLAALPPVPLNLDIKQTEPSMVGPLLEVLEAHRALERVQLASFSVDNVRQVLSAGYPGPVALSREEMIALVFTPRLALKAIRRNSRARRRAQIPPRAGPINLSSRRFIDKCHDVGLAVDYWTINEPAKARALLGKGADGIMTDDVAAVRSAF